MAYIDKCPIEEIGGEDQGLRKSLYIIDRTINDPSTKVKLDNSSTIPFQKSIGRRISAIFR